MKVIPKYQTGGNIYNSWFTTYTPIQIESPAQVARQQRSDSTSKSSDNEKFTEKDFFKILKDIKGLPNEVNAIATNLMNTLQISSLTGVDPGDLATTYLKNLYSITVAAQNKDTYDKAIEQANKNGSMAEPAITMDGKLLAQDANGNISDIDLDNYFQNKDKYHLLSVSNLANLRAFHPGLAYKQEIFSVINNSVGFELFQSLIKQASETLGTTEYTRNGLFSVEGQAAKGLELLQNLSKDDRVQALGSVTTDGLYKYKIIDKNQLNQINALTNYMLAILPNNVKTWAAFKLETSNKNKATRDLVFQYLLSGNSSQHTIDVDYQGLMDEITGNNKESNKNNKAVSDTINMNTAMKWLAGFGTYDIFTINPGSNDDTQVISNTMPLTDSDGKYLGANSILQQASQGEYAGILDFNNTSMGMQKIDPVNFGKVVLTDGKISSIDYPSKILNGIIVPDLSPETAQAKLAADREIKQLGINLSDQDSIKRNYQQINNIYQEHKLQPAYNPDGTPANNWHRFGVINASASNNTLGLGVMDNNELLQIIQDDAIVDNLLQITKEENYDKNELYNPADWGGNYDHFYRGTVWIPVKTSYIAASANNSMKVNEVMNISQREQALNSSNILTKEKK